MLNSNNILLYLRKSRQDNPNQTVEEVLSQHKRIADEWIQNNLDDVIPDSNIYLERASGETIKERVEFQKVLKMIENSNIEAVFVIEPQRLTRGDLEDCGHVMNVFRYTNTKIITTHRTYDLSDESDRMILEMELKSGNQYLEYTKKILKRGKDDAVKRGMWIPSKPPFGYDIVKIGKNRTLKPNSQAETVKLIYKMYIEGYGTAVIARHLTDCGIKPVNEGDFPIKSVNRILKNPTYTGKVIWNHHVSKNVVIDGKIVKKRVANEGQIYEGIHEAIISDEDFEKVQKLFGTVSHIKKNAKPNNILRGMIFCEKCGRILTQQGYSDKHLRHACKNIYCDCGCARSDYLYEDVTEAIKKEIKNKKLLIKNDGSALHDEWKKKRERIIKSIDALNEKEVKMWDDRYSDSPMPENVFRRLSDNLIEERNRLRSNLAILEQSEPNVYETKEVITTLQDALDCMNGDFSVEQKNKMLRACIDRIEFYRPKVSGSTVNSYDRIPYTLNIFFKF